MVRCVLLLLGSPEGFTSCPWITVATLIAALKSKEHPPPHLPQLRAILLLSSASGVAARCSSGPQSINGISASLCSDDAGYFSPATCNTPPVGSALPQQCVCTADGSIDGSSCKASELPPGGSCASGLQCGGATGSWNCRGSYCCSDPACTTSCDKTGKCGSGPPAPSTSTPYAGTVTTTGIYFGPGCTGNNLISSTLSAKGSDCSGPFTLSGFTSWTTYVISVSVWPPLMVS